MMHDVPESVAPAPWSRSPRIRLAHGTREERSEYWRAVDVVRTLIPEALTERDPTPDRRVLLEIVPTEISGREASTRYLSRTP